MDPEGHSNAQVDIRFEIQSNTRRMFLQSHCFHLHPSNTWSKRAIIHHNPSFAPCRIVPRLLAYCGWNSSGSGSRPGVPFQRTRQRIHPRTLSPNCCAQVWEQHDTVAWEIHPIDCKETARPKSLRSNQTQHCYAKKFISLGKCHWRKIIFESISETQFADWGCAGRVDRLPVVWSFTKFVIKLTSKCKKIHLTVERFLCFWWRRSTRRIVLLMFLLFEVRKLCESWPWFWSKRCGQSHQKRCIFLLSIIVGWLKPWCSSIDQNPYPLFYDVSLVAYCSSATSGKVNPRRSAGTGQGQQNVKGDPEIYWWMGFLGRWIHSASWLHWISRRVCCKSNEKLCSLSSRIQYCFEIHTRAPFEAWPYLWATGRVQSWRRCLDS